VLQRLAARRQTYSPLPHTLPMSISGPPCLSRLSGCYFTLFNSSSYRHLHILHILPLFGLHSLFLHIRYFLDTLQKASSLTQLPADRVSVIPTNLAQSLCFPYFERTCLATLSIVIPCFALDPRLSYACAELHLPSLLSLSISRSSAREEALSIMLSLSNIGAG
jgi:hypothetical protein